MDAILGAATAVKVVLFIYCFALKGQSDSMLALAEDHSNDIVSNLGAIACGAIASISPRVWWVDSVGAILISLYIIWSWARILQGQVRRAFAYALHVLACFGPLQVSTTNVQLSQVGNGRLLLGTL